MTWQHSHGGSAKPSGAIYEPAPQRSRTGEDEKPGFWPSIFRPAGAPNLRGSFRVRMNIHSFGNMRPWLELDAKSAAEKRSRGIAASIMAFLRLAKLKRNPRAVHMWFSRAQS